MYSGEKFVVVAVVDVCVEITETLRRFIVILLHRGDILEFVLTAESVVFIKSQPYFSTGILGLLFKF